MLDDDEISFNPHNMSFTRAEECPNSTYRQDCLARSRPVAALPHLSQASSSDFVARPFTVKTSDKSSEELHKDKAVMPLQVDHLRMTEKMSSVVLCHQQGQNMLSLPRPDRRTPTGPVQIHKRSHRGLISAGFG
jgi:hypothetical protein